MNRVSRAIALLLLIAGGLFGCAEQRGGSITSESDAAAIRQASSDFALHAEAGDWDAVAALYTEEAVVMPPGQETVIGRSAILDLFSPLTISDFQLVTAEIDGRGDLAFARGTYVWTVRVGDGEPVPDGGKWLTVWRKQADGTWLLSQDIWNSDQTP